MEASESVANKQSPELDTQGGKGKLSMSEPTIARHLLNKAIEIARDERGNLCVLCEKCDRVIHEGDKWCCVWAKGMAWSYLMDRIKPQDEAQERVA
jgi:hypothetical protein